MEKEFTPYEQALALKELGFDEPCFGVYTVNNRNLFIVTPIKDESFGYLNTPTFSQAFRWFREPKNGSYNHLDFMYEYLKDDSVTYEEAELECLKKLIEIVKNKKESV